MGHNIIIRFLFVITLIAGTFNIGYGEDKNPLLKETEHKFDRLGLGLKGNVFSIVTKYVKHRQEFGQDKITGEFTTDSIVFDQEGRIVSHYYNPEIDNGWGKYLRTSEKYIYRGNDVLKINGEISLYDRIVGTDRDSVLFKREFDNQGRLIQETTYIDDRPTTQIKFQYIPGGYEVKYYPSLESEATIYALKNGVVKITASSIGGKIYPYDTYYLDKNEKIIRNIKYPRLTLGRQPYGTKYYSYNTFGDLIKEEMVWSSGGRKDVKTYSYEYDNQGNWISKMSKDGNEIEWQRREIIYKTPDEIILHNQQEINNKLQFEENLQRKARDYAHMFNSEQKLKRIDGLTDWHACVSAWNKVPIRVDSILRYQVNGDKYSFTFSDGSEFNDIEFSITDDYDSFFLSDDLRVILVPRYDTYYGPQWYVAKYLDNWMDNFNKSDSIDWVSVYYQEYNYKDKVSDEQLEELWRKELLRNEPDIHISYYDNNKILINKLNNPYQNGFVSPRISSKRYEQKAMTTYQNRIDQEEAERLCALVYQVCEYWIKNKEQNKLLKDFESYGAAKPALAGLKSGYGYTPSKNIKIEKLKEFEINGDAYTFTKKDKSVISNVHFNRKVCDLDYSYHNFGLLSDDKKCALIIYRNSETQDFIYLVELDGDDITSINYIPYKKSNDFIIPQLQK